MWRGHHFQSECPRDKGRAFWIHFHQHHTWGQGGEQYGTSSKQWTATTTHAFVFLFGQMMESSRIRHSTCNSVASAAQLYKHSRPQRHYVASPSPGEHTVTIGWKRESQESIALSTPCRRKTSSDRARKRRHRRPTRLSPPRASP